VRQIGYDEGPTSSLAPVGHGLLVRRDKDRELKVSNQARERFTVIDVWAPDTPLGDCPTNPKVF
jgi:hypothetical protein